MAAHAGVSRLMYVMGRDGVFPERFFGYVHPKWRTPALNVLLVGAIALLAIRFDTVTATALINFGALVAFTFVNLSVISQFWIREKRRHTLKDNINYLVLPLCGALTVGALWINLEEFDGAGPDLGGSRYHLRPSSPAASVIRCRSTAKNRSDSTR